MRGKGRKGKKNSSFEVFSIQKATSKDKPVSYLLHRIQPRIVVISGEKGHL